jgi:hypothetical protein
MSLYIVIYILVMAIVFLGVYLWKRNHKSKKQNTSKETNKTVKSKTDILAELENELVIVPESQPETQIPIVTPEMMQALKEPHNGQFPVIPGVEFAKNNQLDNPIGQLNTEVITQGFENIIKTLESLRNEISSLKSQIKTPAPTRSRRSRTSPKPEMAVK